MKKVALYSLLILLIQINCMAIAQNHSHTDILLPDNTIEGFLPNGLHYIILPNENPKNIVEMRLVMDLGSNLEKHDEKGVAHYLEHVAFIGTKNFPDRSMVEFWEKYGMKFGKDINAYTGYDRTIYMVTLPTTEKNDKIIDTSLFALKDWLCNISFKKERTNREKGIILEELNGYTIDDEFHDLKIGTNEFSNHFPLSNSKNISEVTYKKLTSFYKKWYAPQLATIVVVGDINAKAVEVKIQDLFSNIKQKKIKGYKKFPLLYDNGVIMKEIKDSLNRNSFIELIIPHDCTIGNTIENTYQKELSYLTASLLNNRFYDRNIECTASDNWYLSNINHFVLSFTEKSKNDLLSQIENASSELNYILNDGFLKEEIERVINRSVEKNTVNNNILSSYFCDNFVDYIISGDKYIQNNNQMELLNTLIKNTNNDSITNFLKKIVSNIDYTLLIAFKNYLPNNETILKEDIVNAWKKGKNKEVSPFVYITKSHNDKFLNETPNCLTINRTSPDNIIKTTKYYSKIDVTEINLNNGVRVLLRPTPNGSNVALFTAFARGGIGDLDSKDFHKYEGTAGFIEMGGINKMPYDVLMSYLYENNISINLAISNYWHTIMGMFSDDKAKEFFNLVYEKIHYPELCYEDFSEIKKEEIKNLNNENLLSQLIKRDPNRLITNELDSLVGNAVKGSFYERKIEDIQNINLDSIANYYTNLFSNSNNLNILVTGDFKIDKIKDYLISTFGSMEKRKEDYKIDSYNNLPTKKYIQEFEGINQNQTTLEYFFAGNYSPSLKNGLILKLMRDILQNRVIEILREKNNIVYSPYVSLFYHGVPEQTYYFNISTAVNFNNTKIAHNIIFDIIDNLKKNPIQTSELESLKLSFVNAKNQALTNEASSMWRDIIINLIKNGESLEHFNNYQSQLDSITPKDIQQGFIDYINKDTFILLHSGKISKDVL